MEMNLQSYLYVRVMKYNEEETDYNDICGSCSSVNTNDHVVVEDVVSDDEDSSVHRFVDDGCVSNRTEIDRCHSPVFGEEELNQRSERRSAYGFDGQAAGSRLADDTEIESLVESLQFEQVGKHVVIHDLVVFKRLRAEEASAALEIRMRLLLNCTAGAFSP